MNIGYPAKEMKQATIGAMRMGLLCCSALTLSLTAVEAQEIVEPGFGGAFWGFHLNHILSQDLDGSCVAVSGTCPMVRPPSAPTKKAGEAVFSPNTIGSTAQWSWAWKATFHLAI